MVLIEERQEEKEECELNGWAQPFLKPTAATAGQRSDRLVGGQDFGGASDAAEGPKLQIYSLKIQNIQM